ncbi:hypothetical protein FHU37_003106 [Allostreptomyces psammosilenae]|uniref:Uncharacterized protein n=1 Tax=Allostreptomyces psammosilenae TaxID=1892865 RepID=A0A852ZUU2_9ACTN|nr:hypothetical protein [Allostreptomyces psammosilenae]
MDGRDDPVGVASVRAVARGCAQSVGGPLPSAPTAVHGMPGTRWAPTAISSDVSLVRGYTPCRGVGVLMAVHGVVEAVTAPRRMSGSR